MIKALKRIESEDNLARLFNEYMKALSTTEIVTEPKFFSMSEFGEGDKYFFNQQVFYRLCILGQSLESIHRRITEAIAEIDNYLTEYKGDWKYFATTNRMRLIAKWGGEDNDYDDENNIIFKDDHDSLDGYTFHRELGSKFEGGSGRGEYIGTSCSADFEITNIFVSKATELNPFKFFKNLPVYKVKENEDGEKEFRVADTAELIEDEINEDIHNQNIVDLFNNVIDFLQTVNDIFWEIEPFKNSIEEYKELRAMLQSALDMSIGKPSINPL
jgi:hypothetical protein